MPANQFVNRNSFSYVQIEVLFQSLPFRYQVDRLRRRSKAIGRVRDRLDSDRIDARSLQGEGSDRILQERIRHRRHSATGPGWRQQQLSGVVSYGPNDNGVIIQDVIPAFFLGSNRGLEQPK